MADVVELAEVVEHGATIRAVHPRRVAEIKHGIFATPELHALMAGGEESASPKAGEDRLPGVFPCALRNEDDIRREIFIHAPQTIGNPRAHARRTGKLRARIDEGDPGIVVDRLGVHGADDRHFVGNPGGVGKEVADPLAALSPLLERDDAFADGKGRLAGGHARDPLALTDGGGQVLPVELFQRELVIKEVDVRGTARLEEVDDPFRLGREVGRALRRGDRLDVGRHQRARRHRAEAEASQSEETATRKVVEVGVKRVHGRLMNSSRLIRVEPIIAKAAGSSPRRFR